MARMTKLMCSSCGRDVLMTTRAYEDLRAQNRGRGLRGFRCDPCQAVARKLEFRNAKDDMPEWRRMALLPEGAKVRGRRRAYRGVNEFRTYRREHPDDLPPDDYGNRIDYQPYDSSQGEQGYGQWRSRQGEGRGGRGSGGGSGVEARGDREDLRDVDGNRAQQDPTPEVDSTRETISARAEVSGVEGGVGAAEGEGTNVADDRSDRAPEAGADGGTRRGSRSGRRRRDRRSDGRVMYKTNCSRCSRPTRVPFKPNPARTIYCRQCMIDKGMRSH